MAQWHEGQSGTRHGRAKGKRNRRSRAVLDTLERLHVDPFEQKLRLAIWLKKKLHRNAFPSGEERLAYLRLYSDVLGDLLRYTCPKLKQIDHWAHIEITQKLQALDGLTDEELQA